MKIYCVFVVIGVFVKVWADPIPTAKPAEDKQESGNQEVQNTTLTEMERWKRTVHHIIAILMEEPAPPPPMHHMPVRGHPMDLPKDMVYVPKYPAPHIPKGRYPVYPPHLYKVPQMYHNYAPHPPPKYQHYPEHYVPHPEQHYFPPPHQEQHYSPPPYPEQHYLPLPPHGNALPVNDLHLQPAHYSNPSPGDYSEPPPPPPPMQYDHPPPQEHHNQEYSQAPALEHHIPEYNQAPALEHHIPEYNQAPALEHHIPEYNQAPALEHHLPDYNQGPSAEQHNVEYNQPPSNEQHMPEYNQPHSPEQYNTEYAQQPPTEQHALQHDQPLMPEHQNDEYGHPPLMNHQEQHALQHDQPLMPEHQNDEYGHPHPMNHQEQHALQHDQPLMPEHQNDEYGHPPPMNHQEQHAPVQVLDDNEENEEMPPDGEFHGDFPAVFSDTGDGRKPNHIPENLIDLYPKLPNDGHQAMHDMQHASGYQEVPDVAPQHSIEPPPPPPQQESYQPPIYEPEPIIQQAPTIPNPPPYTLNDIPKKPPFSSHVETLDNQKMNSPASSNYQGQMTYMQESRNLQLVPQFVIQDYSNTPNPDQHQNHQMGIGPIYMPPLHLIASPHHSQGSNPIPMLNNAPNEILLSPHAETQQSSPEHYSHDVHKPHEDYHHEHHNQDTQEPPFYGLKEQVPPSEALHVKYHDDAEDIFLDFASKPTDLENNVPPMHMSDLSHQSESHPQGSDHHHPLLEQLVPLTHQPESHQFGDLVPPQKEHHFGDLVPPAPKPHHLGDLMSHQPESHKFGDLVPQQHESHHLIELAPHQQESHHFGELVPQQHESHHFAELVPHQEESHHFGDVIPIQEPTSDHRPHEETKPELHDEIKSSPDAYHPNSHSEHDSHHPGGLFTTTFETGMHEGAQSLHDYGGNAHQPELIHHEHEAHLSDSHMEQLLLPDVHHELEPDLHQHEMHQETLQNGHLHHEVHLPHHEPQLVHISNDHHEHGNLPQHSHEHDELQQHKKPKPVGEYEIKPVKTLVHVHSPHHPDGLVVQYNDDAEDLFLDFAPEPSDPDNHKPPPPDHHQHLMEDVHFDLHHTDSIHEQPSPHHEHEDSKHFEDHHQHHFDNTPETTHISNPHETGPHSFSELHHNSEAQSLTNEIYHEPHHLQPIEHSMHDSTPYKQEMSNEHHEESFGEHSPEHYPMPLNVHEAPLLHPTESSHEHHLENIPSHHELSHDHHSNGQVHHDIIYEPQTIHPIHPIHPPPPPHYTPSLHPMPIHSHSPEYQPQIPMEKPTPQHYTNEEHHHPQPIPHNIDPHMQSQQPSAIPMVILAEPMHEEKPHLNMDIKPLPPPPPHYTPSLYPMPIHSHSPEYQSQIPMEKPTPQHYTNEEHHHPQPIPYNIGPHMQSQQPSAIPMAILAEPMHEEKPHLNMDIKHPQAHHLPTETHHDIKYEQPQHNEPNYTPGSHSGYSIHVQHPSPKPYETNYNSEKPQTYVSSQQHQQVYAPNPVPHSGYKVHVQQENVKSQPESYHDVSMIQGNGYDIHVQHEKPKNHYETSDEHYTQAPHEASGYDIHVQHESPVPSPHHSTYSEEYKSKPVHQNGYEIHVQHPQPKPDGYQTSQQIPTLHHLSYDINIQHEGKYKPESMHNPNHQVNYGSPAPPLNQNAGYHVHLEQDIDQSHAPMHFYQGQESKKHEKVYKQSPLPNIGELHIDHVQPIPMSLHSLKTNHQTRHSTIGEQEQQNIQSTNPTLHHVAYDISIKHEEKVKPKPIENNAPPAIQSEAYHVHMNQDIQQSIPSSHSGYKPSAAVGYDLHIEYAHPIPISTPNPQYNAQPNYDTDGHQHQQVEKITPPKKVYHAAIRQDLHIIRNMKNYQPPNLHSQGHQRKGNQAPSSRSMTDAQPIENLKQASPPDQKIKVKKPVDLPVKPAIQLSHQPNKITSAYEIIHQNDQFKEYRESQGTSSQVAASNYETATIPGTAGIDYPVYSYQPPSSFTCDLKLPGFFADIESRCQVWYYCDLDGRQESFLCPNGTLFNQKHLNCDWWYNVECNEAEHYFQRNAELYNQISHAQEVKNRLSPQSFPSQILSRKSDNADEIKLEPLNEKKKGKSR